MVQCDGVGCEGVENVSAPFAKETPTPTVAVQAVAAVGAEVAGEVKSRVCGWKGAAGHGDDDNIVNAFKPYSVLYFESV